jgi:hypothetical protein
MKTTKSMIMRTLLSAAAVFSILGLVLVMMVGVAAAAEVTPDGIYVSDDDMFTYTVTNGQAQIISYNCNMVSTTAVNIPSTLTVTIRGVETTSTVTSLEENFLLYEMVGATSFQVDADNVSFSSREFMIKQAQH